MSLATTALSTEPSSSSSCQSMTSSLLLSSSFEQQQQHSAAADDDEPVSSSNNSRNSTSRDLMKAAATTTSTSSSSSSCNNSSSCTSSSSSYFPIHEDSPVFDKSIASQLVKYGCKKVRSSGILQMFNEQQQQNQQQLVLKHSDIILNECIGKGSFSSCYSVKSINNNTTTTNRKQQKLLDASKVVVKVLRRKAMDDPKMFATCAGDLFKEALMLSCLSDDNKHIITAKAYGYGGIMSYRSGRHDSFFIVLERLQETLSKRISYWQIQRNKLTFKLPSQEKSTKKLALLEAKTQTILQLADAITYIHSKGIIHRDIKPDNIGFDMSTEDGGNLKVFDFDVARVLPTTSTQEVVDVSKASDSETSIEESSLEEEASSSSLQQQPQHHHHNDQSNSSSLSLTQALHRDDNEEPVTTRRRRISSPVDEETFKMTSKIGSSRYMSPEVACENKKYNQKSDVYTFGLIIHEIITLEKPYDCIWSGYHEEAVWKDGERPWINKRSWTTNLIEIVQQCWNQNLHKRPTMVEAYDLLKEELPKYVEYKMNKTKSMFWLFSSNSKGGMKRSTTDGNNSSNSNSNKANNNTLSSLSSLPVVQINDDNIKNKKETNKTTSGR